MDVSRLSRLTASRSDGDIQLYPERPLAVLLDHRGRLHQYRIGNLDAERFCRLAVDNMPDSQESLSMAGRGRQPTFTTDCFRPIADCPFSPELPFVSDYGGDERANAPPSSIETLVSFERGSLAYTPEIN